MPASTSTSQRQRHRHRVRLWCWRRKSSCCCCSSWSPSGHSCPIPDSLPVPAAVAGAAAFRVVAACLGICCGSAVHWFLLMDAGIRFVWACESACHWVSLSVCVHRSNTSSACWCASEQTHYQSPPRDCCLAKQLSKCRRPAVAARVVVFFKHLVTAHTFLAILHWKK